MSKTFEKDSHRCVVREGFARLIYDGECNLICERAATAAFVSSRRCCDRAAEGSPTLAKHIIVPLERPPFPFYLLLFFLVQSFFSRCTSFLCFPCPPCVLKHHHSLPVRVRKSNARRRLESGAGYTCRPVQDHYEYMFASAYSTIRHRKDHIKCSGIFLDHAEGASIHDVCGLFDIPVWCQRL